MEHCAALFYMDIPIEEKIILVRPEGIDPEIAEHVEICDELGLYLFLSSQGAFLFKMAIDIQRPEIRKEPEILSEMNTALGKIQVIMNYSISQTSRFGVGSPLEELPNRVIGQPTIKVPSKEYRLWYDWWYKFIYGDKKNLESYPGLTDDEWDKLKVQIENNEDTSKIRPPGDWRPVDGIMPRAWLKKVTSFEEIEKEWTPASEKQWEALKNYSRKEDILWIFENPETKEHGVALVKNNRPAASIYLKEKK